MYALACTLMHTQLHVVSRYHPMWVSVSRTCELACKMPIRVSWMKRSLSLSLSPPSPRRHLSSFLSLSYLASRCTRRILRKESCLPASRKGEGAKRDASRRRFRSRDLAKRERKGIRRSRSKDVENIASHPVGSDTRSFVRPYASTPGEDPPRM